MAFIITSVTDPHYSRHNKKAIDCMISINGGTPIPFTATPHDDVLHGRELWNNLNAGIYGPIGEFRRRQE